MSNDASCMHEETVYHSLKSCTTNAPVTTDIHLMFHLLTSLDFDAHLVRDYVHLINTSNNDDYVHYITICQ